MTFFAGIISSLSFAPLYFFLGPIIGVGFLFFILNKENNLKSLLFGYVYGLGYYLCLLYWVGIAVKFEDYFYLLYILITIGLALILSVFFIIFAYIYLLFKKALNKLTNLNLDPLIFAISWVFIEYLRTFIPFGGFPWGLISYSCWFSLEILQIISIIGELGLSFILCFVICLFIKALQSINKIEKIFNLFIAVIIIASLYIFGYFRIKSNSIEFTDIKINLIQMSLNDHDIIEKLKKDVNNYIKTDEFQNISNKYTEDQYKSIEWKKYINLSNIVDSEHIKIKTKLVNKIQIGAINVFGEDINFFHDIDNLIYDNSQNKLKYNQLQNNLDSENNTNISIITKNLTTEEDKNNNINSIDNSSVNNNKKINNINLKSSLNANNNDVIVFSCGDVGMQSVTNQLNLLSLNLETKKFEYIIGYDKVHLVPFGEYFPEFLNSKYLSIISEIITPFAGFYTPGELNQDAIHFEFNKQKLLFFPSICYEIIFSHEMKKAYQNWMYYIQKHRLANQNSDFKKLNNHNLKNFHAIINATNDSWYRYSSGPYQHLQNCIFRAIEFGIPVIRAAKTGISAIIAPNGQIIASLDLGKKNNTIGLLPKTFKRTIYTQYKYNELILILYISLFYITIHFLFKKKVL
ncbi:MAG: nitrilase-related carbon-nitrogen hydrolase [Rickettsiales bacterium]